MKTLTRILIVCCLLLGGVAAGTSPASAQSPVEWRYEDVVGRPDLHQGHADVMRLYWAFLAREPDNQGADYWIRSYNSCDWGTDRIAQFFSVSPEFVATYGSPTNEEFIDLIYSNVFGRAPDAGGKAFWVARLAGGQTRGSMVADLSFSPEFRTAHPLPSDGRANTGCESTTDTIYDPISLFIAFGEAWNASDWDTMATFSQADVVTEAQAWQADPGLTYNISADDAWNTLSLCGRPGSNEIACHIGVDGDNGLGLIFDIVLYDTGDGFEVIYLSYLGDAG